MSTDYWLVPSFKAGQIQTHSITKGGKVAEIAKGLGGPWATTAPTSWGDADHTQLQLKERAQRSRQTCCQMTDVLQRNKDQRVGSLHIKAGIYTYHFHSR